MKTTKSVLESLPHVKRPASECVPVLQVQRSVEEQISSYIEDVLIFITIGMPDHARSLYSSVEKAITNEVPGAEFPPFPDDEAIKVFLGEKYFTEFVENRDAKELKRAHF